MKCPHCEKEIDVATLHYDEAIQSGFDSCDHYFNEDVCTCPECGKEFIRVTYYRLVPDHYVVSRSTNWCDE